MAHPDVQYAEAPFRKLLSLVQIEPHYPIFKIEDHDTSIDLRRVDFTTADRQTEKMYYRALSKFIGRAVAGGRPMSRTLADGSHSKSPGRGKHRRDDCLFMLLTEDETSLEVLCKDASVESEPSNERVEYVEYNSFTHALAGGAVTVSRPGFGVTQDDPFLPSNDDAKKTRGELCDYATEIQLLQHRQFLFMFYVYHTSARIIRWDRLYEFFYRLGRASDIQLGLDPTATMIHQQFGNVGHLKILKDALSALDPGARVTTYIRKAFSSDDSSSPYFVLQVPEKEDPKMMRSFLVRNLSSHSGSPTGRATKGYIAFDLKTKSFRFLKDSWRSDSPRVHPELDVYDRLEPLHVRYFATVCCGGDLRVLHGETTRIQRTLTQKFELANEYLPRIHTRLVMNEVGIPLKDYKHSRELCSVVFCAFKAHSVAWGAGILHRDISDGNIVIYDDPITKKTRGLLIDWDLCKYKEELGKGPKQSSRPGTWRFMSAALLNYPKKDNEVADDIESFLHLLVIFALRFHSRNLSAAELKPTLILFYDLYYMREGYYMGSVSKLHSVCDGHFPLNICIENPLRQLLDRLAAICKEHYNHLDLDDLKAKYGVPDPDAPARSTNTPNKRKAKAKVTKFIDYGTHIQSTHIAPPSSATLSSHTASAPLSDHHAFGSTFTTALQRNTWYAGDKGRDLFSQIDWKGTFDVTSGSESSLPHGKRGRSLSSGLSVDDESEDESNGSQRPAAKKARVSS